MPHPLVQVTLALSNRAMNGPCRPLAEAFRLGALSLLISRVVSVMYSRRRRDGFEVDFRRFRVDGCCVQFVMFRDIASGGGFRHSALQSNCLREVFLR